jgi:hypothetical protein
MDGRGDWGPWSKSRVLFSADRGEGERFNTGPTWLLPSLPVTGRLSEGKEGESVRPNLCGASEYRDVFFLMQGGDWSRTGVRDFVIGLKKEKSAKSVLERTLRRGGRRAAGDGTPLESEFGKACP